MSSDRSDGKRTVFVNHRNHTELVETLANVPRGTFYKYEALKEMIPESKSTEFWSNAREVKLAEDHFNAQLKKNPSLKRLRDFMTKGLGRAQVGRPSKTIGKAKIRKILLEIYWQHTPHFRQFYVKSPYVKDWYEYLNLVRSVGLYW